MEQKIKLPVILFYPKLISCKQAAHLYLSTKTLSLISFLSFYFIFFYLFVSNYFKCTKSVVRREYFCGKLNLFCMPFYAILCGSFDSFCCLKILYMHVSLCLMKFFKDKNFTCFGSGIALQSDTAIRTAKLAQVWLELVIRYCTGIDVNEYNPSSKLVLFFLC